LLSRFISATSDAEHEADAVFAKVLLLIRKAFLIAPPSLKVGYADDQNVKVQADKRPRGKIVENLIPSFAFVIVGQKPIFAHTASRKKGSSCARNSADVLTTAMTISAISSGCFIIRAKRIERTDRSNVFSRFRHANRHLMS